jgi:hypothetical protein
MNEGVSGLGSVYHIFLGPSSKDTHRERSQASNLCSELRLGCA